MTYTVLGLNKTIFIDLSSYVFLVTLILLNYFFYFMSNMRIVK
jgi:hypothetical protein